MRLLCAAALVAATGLFAARAQEKKDPPADAPKADERAEKLKGLRKAFNDEFGELNAKFQKAGSPAEKQAVRDEAKELATLTAEKVVKLVDENPKDEAAADGIRFVFTQLVPLRATGASVDKLVGVVTEHHINSPVAKDLVRLAGRMGPTGEKLLQAAAEKATDKEVKGTALYYLGAELAEKSDDAADEKAAAELTAKAIGYLERAAKEAGDVRLGRQTIAKMAEGDIQALKTLGVGKPAPDVEGSDLDDKKVKLSSYKGKVVLLDVWATWCGPCRAMIPHERELVKKMADKPFVLLSVSADDEKETLTKFLDKEPMPWSHWWAGGEGDAVLKTFRVKAFPTMYLIDAKGVIRKKWVGSPGNEVLDKAIEDLVKEAGTKG